MERDNEAYKSMCRGAGVQPKHYGGSGGGKAMSGLDLVTVIGNQLPEANRKAVRGLAACLIEIFDSAGTQAGRVQDDLYRLMTEIGGSQEYRNLLKPQVGSVIEPSK